ncbi:LuxR C-terminal-related transcriptional regulator [Gordonia sp. NPDC003376]
MLTIIDDEARPRAHRTDPIVGRRAELALLDGFIVAITAGDAPVVGVVGAPLIGVTTLMTGCAARADAAGITVLRASGTESETDIPFATLQELLLPVVTEPAAPTALRIALGLDDGTRPDEDTVIADTRALLADLAATAGLLVVVDDHHLADPFSCRVIAACAGIPATGILLGTHGAALDPAPPTTTIHLAPLDTGSAGILLRRRHPDIADTVAAQVIGWSSGNPLVLDEIADSLSSRQRAGTGDLPRVLPISRRLRRRARDTPPPGSTHAVPDPDGALVEFLRSLALPSGSGTDEARRSRILDDSLAWARCTGDEQDTLIRIAATGVEPGRATALEDHLVGLRRDRHTAPADAAEIILGLSLLAEIKVAAGNVDDGVALLREAATRAPTSARRARLIGRAVGVAAVTDVALAAELMEHLRTDDPYFGRSLVAATGAAAVLAHGPRGDIDAAHRILHSVLDRQPVVHHGVTPYAGPVVVDALRALRWATWLARRPERWDFYHAAVERLSPDSRHPLDEATVDGRVDMARIDALILRLDDPSTPPVDVVLIGETASAVDHLGECRKAIEAMSDLATRRDLPMIKMWIDLQLSLDDLNRGEYAAVIAAHGGVRHRDHDPTVAPNMLGWAADYHLAIAHARRGEVDIAIRIAESTAAWALPRRAHTVTGCAEHVLAICATARDDHESAYTHLAAITPPGTCLEPSWWATAVDFEIVHAAVRTGRRDVARRHVTAMQRGGYPERSAPAQMLYLTSCALVSSGASAHRFFAEALAVPGTERWVFDRARVQFLAGSALRRGHALARSRPLLADAASAFSRIGAQPWADWAHREWEATAATRRKTSTSGADASPRPLTPRERHIAALAAEGLSNKDIAARLVMSPRTVGNHLHRVYAKLTVTSRLALRDALAQLSDPGPAD